MLIPACVPCWNGPMCRWHSVGACWFGHSDESEALVQRDGLFALSAEVQELRSALRRLASHVMWHNGAVVGSQQEPAKERSSARTSGTTPSSVRQATGGVQRVISPQKTASSMKHSGGEDSDDEKWYSGDEDDVPVPQILENPVTPVPQFQEETVEVIQPIPTECISEHITEGTCPQERTSERTQIVEPVPQILEIIPQHISERTQTVDVQVPQNLGTILQERISERTQSVDASFADFGDRPPGARLGAYTDRRCDSAAEFGDHSPGAHLGAYTDRCASAAN